MADVEQRAEAEAAAKGLSGQARTSYIGGVFNKIRQAHARAIQPGKGKTFLANLNRRNRQLARARYHEALAPHEQAVAELKRQRKHELAQLSYEKQTKREEPSEYTRGEYRAALARHDYESAMRWGKHISPQAVADAQRLHDEAQRHKRAPKRAPAERQRQRAIAQAIQHGAPDFPPGTLAAAQGKPTAKPAQPPAEPSPERELTPRQLSDYDKLLIERRLQEHRAPNGMRPSLSEPSVAKPAWFYRELYGDKQTRAALDRYPMERLREIAVTSGVASSGSRQQLLNRLEAAAQGKPAAKPAPPAAVARAATPTKIEPFRHIDVEMGFNPYFVAEHYSRNDTRRLIESQSADRLMEGIHAVEARTGRKYNGRKSKSAMAAWILANMAQKGGGDGQR